MDLFTDREAEVDRLCASLAPQSSDMEDLQTQDSPPSASRDEEPSLEAANTSLLQEKVHELVLHTAVHVMQCLGQLDTSPKFFLHAWIHIATAHPVFLLPYYGLRKRSIAMCVS